MINLAWHYTTGKKFIMISESEQLQPTAIGVRPPEKPILWFSKNPYWEKTANKAIQDNNKIKTLTMKQTFELGNGLYRFGIKVKRIHQWNKLKKKARMPP